MADEEDDQRRSGAFGASTTQVGLKLFLPAVSLSDDQKIDISFYHDNLFESYLPAKPARGASHEKLPHTPGTKKTCTSSGFVKSLVLYV